MKDLFLEEDTIAAISTGLTESGIGIIRISGPQSFEIAGRILETRRGERPSFDEPNRVRRMYAVNVSRETIDEVLVVNLKAPGSYTGEDTVEIDCHGGVLVMKKILSAALDAGARPAEPGEFTKRAFLNGRIDLSQAEAIADIIGSRSEAALKTSVSQLKGSVSEAVRKLRGGILEDAAFIEAALDDPEHYSLDGFPPRLYERTERAVEDLRRLIDSFRRGKFLREGIDTVIAGLPNAGKSSLLNMMLGEDRAIVTEVPGTTRDLIRESLDIGGVSLNLIDTAGLRESFDPVEKIGIERTRKAIREADLVLYVIDAALSPNDALSGAADLCRETKARIVLVFNKADLVPGMGYGIAVGEILRKGTPAAGAVALSALSGEGAEELYHLIEKLFEEGIVISDGTPVISSIRQKNLLEKAGASLKRVCESIENRLPEDFFTIDLMEAYRLLGEILGEEVSDDLVDEIFSKFCLGK